MLQPGPLKAAQRARIELDHGPTPGHGKPNSAQKRSVWGLPARFPQDLACLLESWRGRPLNRRKFETEAARSFNRLKSNLSGLTGGSLRSAGDGAPPRIDLRLRHYRIEVIRQHLSSFLTTEPYASKVAIEFLLIQTDAPASITAGRLHLAGLFIDALLQLVDHLINAEARRSLTRRIFLERAEEGRDPPYTVLN